MLEIILVQGFHPLESKITQFPNESVLKVSFPCNPSICNSPPCSSFLHFQMSCKLYQAKTLPVYKSII